MAPPVKDVSVAGFADLLGRTKERVYQLIQEGMPHRKRGKAATRIVPREAIEWLIARAKEVAQPTTEQPRSRERKELAEARLKEAQVEQLLGTLVPMAEAEAFQDALIGGFSAVAAGRLQRFERDMVTAANAVDARKLTERIHRALMEGAQEYAEQLDEQASQIESAGQDKGEAAA